MLDARSNVLRASIIKKRMLKLFSIGDKVFHFWPHCKLAKNLRHQPASLR
jgi:hypothetical protein